MSETRAAAPHYLRKWFEFEHLPIDLQAASQPFRDLAEELDDTLVDGAEKTTALRKLLEAKDAAVRATIEGRPAERAAAIEAARTKS